MTEAVFYLFATIAVLSALLCVTQRNPIASAFWLISTMLCLAGMTTSPARRNSAGFMRETQLGKAAMRMPRDSR